ncbi:hypothetical protein L3049_19105 [Labilibaculum sp. DW002]|uniref:Uncharacterized protein n=1 Tax=Paralabilibaculum antarcticum TaxID=2912572 RepID=A0ABT5VXW0_9BACT|nr:MULTISPECIES: hypothetical protein [unclassified Labilibaculum]MBI9059614.1 hypothetical protein [Labilibaculum sp.]MDE5420105.1 hypothetical protein [Labilibaculum sp. DW002]
MKQKLPFILEIIWFVVMIVALAAAIHKTTQSGFSESILLYVIALVATLMFASRRYMRKLQEKNQSPK